MVQCRQRERSLFEVLLPDGHRLWPDWLRKIDALLEDEAVIEVVVIRLAMRDAVRDARAGVAEVGWKISIRGGQDVRRWPWSFSLNP